MSYARALALTLCLGGPLAGCFYSFDNPVEQKADGVIVGQCALTAPTAGQPTQGGEVALLFSALQTPLQSNGKFLFFDLPNGNYALKCSIPAAVATDFPLIAERPSVSLPKSASGVSDSINVGAVAIAATGIVSGTVSGAVGPVTVAAYFPPPAGSDGGLGGYEALSTAADPTTGAFSIALPPGNHVLAAGDPAQAAIAAVTVQGGTTQSQDLTLVAPSASATTSLDGLLVLDGTSLGAAADPNTLATLLGFVSFSLADAAGNVLSQGPFPASSAGVLDGHFHLVVPVDSSTVTLTFTLSSGASFNDPSQHLSTFVLSGLPVIPGQSTQLLPQVTWIDDGDLAANSPDAGVDAGTDGGSFDGGPDAGIDAGADGGTLDAGADGGAWTPIEGPVLIPDAGFVELVILPLDATTQLVAASGAALAGNQSISGTGDLWVGQLTSAGFGPVQWLTDAGGFFQDSLSGAADSNGNALVAWGSTFGDEDSFTSGLGLALIQSGVVVNTPDSGPGLAALSPAISYFGKSTTTFTGKLGAVAGFFTVVPDTAGGTFDAVFVTPSVPQGATVFSLVTDGGFTGAINLVGEACTLPELSGGAGFCIATAESGSGGYHGVIFAVATADGGATVVSQADLGVLSAPDIFDDVSSAGIGLARNDAGEMLATFEGQQLGGDGNTYSTTLLVAGPFTTLVTPPVVSSFVVPSTVTALLPDPEGFLGLGGVTADPASGLAALLFEPTAAADGGVATPLALVPPLACLSSGSPESISAYRDPVTNLPVVGCQSVQPNQLTLFALHDVP